jgi:hypothetical protein
MTQATPANYVWWLAGRSAGMVALLLVAGSVILGLAMAARVIPPRRPFACISTSRCCRWERSRRTARCWRPTLG